MTAQLEWREPETAEIDRAAAAILDNAWRAVFEERVEDIRHPLPGEAFPWPEIDALWRYWRRVSALSDDGRFRAADIEPLRLRGALGNLIVAEPMDDGFDAFYRIYGGNIALTAGHDWTGFRLSQMNRGARTRLALFHRAAYRAVYLSARPLVTRHRSAPAGGFARWHRLILPARDEAGAVSRFVVGLVPTDGAVAGLGEWSALAARLDASEKGPS